MDPIDLIHLQITLEYALDASGRLVPFPGSSEQGLYIVYKAENHASRALARSLGAVWYADVVCYA